VSPTIGDGFDGEMALGRAARATAVFLGSQLTLYWGMNKES
jgi:hypothetical protein